MLYVNVGGNFEIVDTPHKIETWGQPVEIPEDLARGAIGSGAHLLPKDQFDKLGFTPDELKLSNANLQARASADFHAKAEKAIEAARQYRDALFSEQVAKAPAPKAEAPVPAPAPNPESPVPSEDK